MRSSLPASAEQRTRRHIEDAPGMVTNQKVPRHFGAGVRVWTLGQENHSNTPPPALLHTIQYD